MKLKAGSYKLSKKLMNNANIAQLVEHLLGKEEVAGSNPAVGSEK